MSRLLNIQTDLKSLKFGNDRPRGGSSNQPYIEYPIPSDDNQLPKDEDFLLRGGASAPIDAAKDVKRLFNLFTDKTSPIGLLFEAKQNLLSLSAVRTQASEGAFNEGVYTPLSTLAQAGIGFLGGHVDKQGINPTEGLRTYTDVFQSVKGGESGDSNRLVLLTESKITNTKSANPITGISSNPTELLSYQGGPGAILGVGRTNIPLPLPNKRTGINNPRIALYSGIKDGRVIPNNISVSGVNNNGSEIELREERILDFKKDSLEGQDSSVIMSISPDYTDPNKRIEGPKGSRINMASPGRRGNIISYTEGKDGGSIVDKINAQPIYQSGTVEKNSNEFSTNDLINFRIAAINKTDSTKKQFIHFRAFIDAFSDTYNANWDAINYMGRAESFYKYNTFGRTINLGFTVAAQSKPELMAQYKKLNFLASNLAPTYSAQGYMGGPLVELTLGGWCYNLPGFITSLTLNVPQESPWEIGIDDDGNADGDNSVRQMPHIVQVTGMQFTPIHTFRPEKQINLYDKTENGDGVISNYGEQRYISLENAVSGSIYNQEFV